MQTSDIAVIGHFSVDNIHLPSRSLRFNILGGSVTFVSLAIRRLEGSVAAISNVGGDFPEAYLWWLNQEGIDLSKVVRFPKERTTRFEIEYNSDFTDRFLFLKGKGSSISCELPSDMKVKTIHVAPIDDEISEESIEDLREHAELLSLDPQGLLRSFDTEGRVTTRDLANKSFLSIVDVYKSSLEEITALTQCSDLDSAVRSIHGFGVKTVIVTLGASGSLLSTEQISCRIPACASKTVIDPTGAGDVFMGGFLAEYTRRKDPIWCACVGSAAASLVVEDIGPRFFGNKEDIYRRAWSIYEKEIKQ